MYETRERRKRAFLVDVYSAPAEKVAAESLGRELRGLAQTLELDISAQELVHVRERQPKFGMGTGKAAELAEKAAQTETDCLILDWNVSPSQQRNWEEATGIPVLDRQELIIKIFAERAATKEAELQVRLAELIYRLPRLSHKYIDLSRQRGGRYGTKGAGETKLETDRRQIEQQIHKLKKDLEEVRKRREVQRKQRDRQGLPVCAIVGYTNAGKSSLLNVLCGADVLVEDKLFATLDATTRRFEPAPGMTVLLTDTVGFIRQLPHSLINAFRSTLEEAARANLLIHVLDAADNDIEHCYQTSLAVLQELGAQNIPQIIVLNKIDVADGAQVEHLLSLFPGSIAVSVKQKTGLDTLKSRIAEEVGLLVPCSLATFMLYLTHECIFVI